MSRKSNSSIGILLVKRPSNNHSPNLRSTSSNLIQLGTKTRQKSDQFQNFKVDKSGENLLSQQSRRGHLLNVAHTAQQLDRVERNLRRPLSSIQNRSGAVLGAN